MSHNCFYAYNSIFQVHVYDLVVNKYEPICEQSSKSISRIVLTSPGLPAWHFRILIGSLVQGW